jgi:hypothetical protein
MRALAVGLAVTGLAVLGLAGRPLAGQGASSVPFGPEMASTERCLAVRDTIGAADWLRACSDSITSLASGTEGRTQRELLSASYRLDSLAERIETGDVAPTPAVARAAFARMQSVLARAHADAARDQWTKEAPAATGRELRLSVAALTASLAERNRRADRATAGRIRTVEAMADSLEHGGAYTDAGVVNAFIALRTALMAVEPR